MSTSLCSETARQIHVNTDRCFFTRQYLAIKLVYKLCVVRAKGFDFCGHNYSRKTCPKCRATSSLVDPFDFHKRVMPLPYTCPITNQAMAVTGVLANLVGLRVRVPGSHFNLQKSYRSPSDSQLASLPVEVLFHFSIKHGVVIRQNCVPGGCNWTLVAFEDGSRVGMTPAEVWRFRLSYKTQ